MRVLVIAAACSTGQWVCRQGLGRVLHITALVYPPQCQPEFECNMSALDLLFNCGPESGKVLCRAH
jgi:hypothetical protein